MFHWVDLDFESLQLSKEGENKQDVFLVGPNPVALVKQKCIISVLIKESSFIFRINTREGVETCNSNLGGPFLHPVV